MLKVIIAGSRGFNYYELLERLLDMYLQRYSPEQIEIVSGGARGADRLGERYARSRGMALKVMPADWNTYGRSAGYRRNEEMAQYATHCIVFWDGASRGTGHMIDLANQYNLALRIVRYRS
jgi:hypothetical protein